MEIIVTDERDERFIEFCASFGCRIEDPQVVLLLDNFGKIVGCSSFKVYDADSAEIITLFLEVLFSFFYFVYLFTVQRSKRKKFGYSITWIHIGKQHSSCPTRYCTS